MKKNIKRILTVCAITLVLSLGVIGGLQITPKIDPPFTLINLK